MRNRKDIDPELHILRSAIRSADGRERSELETARFQLYAAFEQRDPDAARRWSKALRAGLLVTDNARLRQLASEALDVIEKAI